MTPLRAHLRTATAASHDRLDAALGRHDLATPDGYAAFLTAQARALPPVEAALEAAGIARLLPDWPERRRRDALAADLAALGLPLPAPVAVAPPDGPAAAWGMAYVLEGSRLGARLLLRRVAGPCAFLAHGAGSDLWRGFLAALEADPYCRAAPDLAAAGAAAAFAAFERAADPETRLA